MAQSADCPSHPTRPVLRTPRPTPQMRSRKAGFSPTPEGSGNGAVIAEFPGPAVPVATGKHPEDHAVQHSPRVRPLATGGFGRVRLHSHRVDLLPKNIPDIPYSGEGVPRRAYGNCLRQDALHSIVGGAVDLLDLDAVAPRRTLSFGPSTQSSPPRGTTPGNGPVSMPATHVAILLMPPATRTPPDFP